MAQPDTELLTEHLGYAPVSLLDSIINVVNSLADRTLDRVEQGLSGASAKTLGFEKALRKKQQQQQRAGTEGEPLPSAEDAAQFEVADGVHKLETLLCNAIDKNFDLFELYVMDNILCVQPTARPWIRLQHYTRGLDFDAVAARDADDHEQSRNAGPTAESVNAIRRNLQGSRRLNAMLRAEQAKNEALLAKLRSIVGGTAGLTSSGGDAVKAEDGAGAASPFAFLSERGGLTDADARTPLTTTAAFTLSQLQAMRSLSTSLRNILPDLGPSGEPDAGGEGGRRGWRRERVEYVEGQTRKHLENVRGLELGKNGEVRDGEWQGAGRKFARGEVEGLEQVALIVGGEPSGPSNRGDRDENGES